MSTKRIDIKYKIFCDFCGKDVDVKNYFSLSGYDPVIVDFNKNTHEFYEQDYCSIECFFGDIRKSLEIS